MATFDPFTANLTAPIRSPQKGELPLTEDRHFAADGKAMMLVLVLLFASLFVFLMVLMCMKRRHIHIHSHAHGLHGHNKPAGHSGLHPPIQFPLANQVKGHSAGSGENSHNMNAQQTV